MTEPPIFIGLDLAWSNRNPSGGAVIRGHELVAVTGDLGDDDAIFAFATRHLAGDGPAVVAVDAPLRVPNATGSRACDNALSAVWRRFEAGALPANRRLLARAGQVRGELLVAGLARCCRVTEAASVPRHHPGRIVCEVYPHPAQVSLFGLDKTLKYKGRRGRTLEERLAAFRRYHHGLPDLVGADPPLVGDIGSLLAVDPATLRGKRLKGHEDALDAVTCAYVAAYLWQHGPSRTRVYGDLAGGHILVPVTPAMARRLVNS